MKVNLYIGTRKVKTDKVKGEIKDLIKRDYKVTLINQKDIMNKFIATTILRPTHMLTDPNKEIDLNCVIYGGAIIE